MNLHSLELVWVLQDQDLASEAQGAVRKSGAHADALGSPVGTREAPGGRRLRGREANCIWQTIVHNIQRFVAL